ncbi:MAG: DUF554 domain-containing protein [Evtepia sp.]
MPATIINCSLILLGCLIGILLKNHMSPRVNGIIMQALGLCVLAIGIPSAIGTDNLLCVIVCLVLGSAVGELLKLEQRLDGVGDFLKHKVFKSKNQDSRFTEAFVTASVLYCVGAMAVMGAIEAGTSGNYSILISKGVIDGVTAISLTAAMGPGVAFSVVPLFLYQGGITLLASLATTLLSPDMINEMSAVGGIIIVGIAFNMLGLPKEKLRVANMLPAIFLPLLYLPLSQWLISVFSGLF